MKAVCYIPMLDGQERDVRQWIESVKCRLGVIVVMLPAVNWNDDLTPWPADPIFRKGKAFGGKGADYLRKLEEDIIPSIEKDLEIIPDERWLLGVSLSGLFAIWAGFMTGLFTRAASVSGSFWYPDFVPWLERRDPARDLKSVYLSLGDKEAQTKNQHLKSIASDTLNVKEILERKGIPVCFEWTEGTHFAPVAPRLEHALEGLISSAGISL